MAFEHTVTVLLYVAWHWVDMELFGYAFLFPHNVIVLPNDSFIMNILYF